jgi:hypothetical protein
MTVGMLTNVVIHFLWTISLPANNTLGGTIPSEIGLMTSLNDLFLSKLIEHERRVEIGITVKMLTIVVVFCPCMMSLPDSNTLGGSIPTEIGLMASLARLVLRKWIEHESRVDFAMTL